MHKRVRRVALDDDDEKDNENDPLSIPATSQLPEKSKDHELLLSSLAASQKASPSKLPTLPAEVLLTVLDNTDPADILEPPARQLMEQLNPQDYWDLAFVNATFERLDERVGNQAVWDPQSAYFRIIEAWYDTFVRGIEEIEPDNPWWHHTVQCLDLRKSPLVHGQLRWCVKVGLTVVDFGMADDKGVDIELTPKKTNSHTAIYRTVFETYDMDNMTPLWGKHSSTTVVRDYEDVELAERNAVQTLMLLRREASMSIRERSALYTMKEERVMMHREVTEVDEQFKKWQESLLGLPNLSLVRIEIDHDVDPNPMTWFKEVMDRESQNLIRWKAQKQTIAHIKAYLDATNAAASIAEDDFDEDDDDF
ncbi:hypothetical protein BKA58DRAFT_398862 [Alternaria rosae]|uniref:uncharacterized protein n=1 Tax=Alternaria rosae TaxID=1187941 RepID=UPI001E8E71B2|nr:uncharacterized protein BKA58DRAFT_398862 [Alternaria rosae]KAH6878866.1 hypothetical protein BKA58DRAFT_398862 [Alternaria rosae]